MKSNRKLKWSTLTAAFIAVVLLVSFVIANIGLPLRAYASTGYAVSSDTFEDMRSRNKCSTSENSFIAEGYQDNNANFEFIKKEKLAGLEDPRYSDITLQDQSDAILRNRLVTGNIDGKKTYGSNTGPEIMPLSTLTVLTYGQGATLSDWSNKGRHANTDDERKEWYKTFYYQADSMIETLRKADEANTDVYVARTLAIQNNTPKKVDENGEDMVVNDYTKFDIKLAQNADSMIEAMRSSIIGFKKSA